ncbi:putative plasmid replication protein RepB [Colwellia psychrerythraea 34H]|uniref:Putative plasmid replication protein RepB n=1 Tax=Colwellia psychrerythraea (strain 34H / ATCC BAA-681) TaxID=167879 RepID=Q48AF6_COLP3|nr:putative plasmid replication protein RepB [Colwellia psychrerythraea 34H]
MEVKELKNVFDAGGLKHAVVSPAFGTKGYEVILTTSKNQNVVLTAQRSDNQPRVFKSIDAAISVTTKIGFRRVLFQLPN